MPLPRIQRGEVWLVDLGYLGKVRPVLVMSVPFLDTERTLCIVVPRTTSLIGTRFEVKISLSTMKDGAFDVQQTAAVQATKFVRRLGALDAQQLRLVERSLAEVLGLKVVESAPINQRANITMLSIDSLFFSATMAVCNGIKNFGSGAWTSSLNF
jgi:mRNA interferase MazF